MSIYALKALSKGGVMVTETLSWWLKAIILVAGIAVPVLMLWWNLGSIV